MRALCLLLVSVVVLACMQASYLVVEAKKHEKHELHITDDAAQEAHYKTKHHKKPREGDKKEKDITEEEKGVEVGDDKQAPKTVEIPSILDQMVGDEPPRSTRRERISKQDRQQKKQERQEARRENKGNNEDGTLTRRQERKQERKEAKKQQRKEAKKEARKAANGQQQGNQGRRQEKEERKRQRQAKKADKLARRQQRTECISQDQCQSGECCLSSKNGQSFCKANNRPRTSGKKCINSCTCAGDLKCFATNDQPERRNKRKLGRCVNGATADLTAGYFIDQIAAPATQTPAGGA